MQLELIAQWLKRIRTIKDGMTYIAHVLVILSMLLGRKVAIKHSLHCL